MFVLFGFRTRDRLLSSSPMVCEVCGVGARQVLVKRSTIFTLFFVPLFPVSRGSYRLECAHCGAARRVDRHTADRLAA
jgi:hypothetical protein